MKLVDKHYKQIKRLQNRYFELLRGHEDLLKLISEVEVAEQVYNSNAIENSTLTLEDTEKILMQIRLDKYVEERELFEAKNLARVVEYINKNAKDKNLDNDMILFLHKILISNIRDEIAGRFRQGKEFVKVGKHIAPAPELIGERLFSMFINYATGGENIIKKISKFHLEFENIHPFIDGNGRIGRVLNNYQLIREGYVSINIKFLDRQKYYQAFKEFDQFGYSSIMEEIVGLALLNSYHKRITYMEHKKIITLKEYSENHKDSYSNLLNKAHRQTIPAFLERGVWKIGV